ncbi:MAG: citrulline utilization hydrolase CtlX [Bacteroidota bacterium]
MDKQTTDNLLMVRPHNFQMNEQTAVNNYFQKQSEGVSKKEIQRKALEEFDGFVDLLDSKGVNVLVIQDTESPVTPDAIFPNNWISFHQDGRVFTYPMFAENRRLERREDILNEISRAYEVNELIDLSAWEKRDQFLEGTGSLVLDRQNKMAYVALSDRANIRVLEEFEKISGYKSVTFRAFQSVDQRRAPIYHTNVMMYVGEAFAVVCAECIDDIEEREMLVSRIKETGKELIELTESQVHQFAGNGLLIRNKNGDRLIVMSTSAYQSLNQNQLKALEKNGEVIHSPLNTIEYCGGGSARCMIAEIFLSKKDHV